MRQNKRKNCRKRTTNWQFFVVFITVHDLVVIDAVVLIMWKFRYLVCLDVTHAKFIGDWLGSSIDSVSVENGLFAIDKASRC